MIRLFVSDLHLDPAAPAGIALFERFCAEVARGADELWILGDLFELWVGDDCDDAAATAVRSQLARLSAAGPRCHLMHGNRDFLVGTELTRACGAELVPDPCPIDLAGERAVLSHGDALCTGDVAYQQLRVQLRSAAFRDDMLARSLAERTAIGADARRRSREANENKAEHIMDVDARAVDELLDAHDASLLLHGHTHRPAVHVWDGPGGPRRRFVLGAWEQACVYAVADAESVELRSWP